MGFLLMIKYKWIICIFILDIWLLWEVVWLGVSDGMVGECVIVSIGL